jgi:hypothetical protein
MDPLRRCNTKDFASDGLPTTESESDWDDCFIMPSRSRRSRSRSHSRGRSHLSASGHPGRGKPTPGPPLICEAPTLPADLQAAPLPLPSPKTTTTALQQRAGRLGVCKKWLQGYCLGTCQGRHPRWQGTTDLFQGVLCQSFLRGGCKSEDCYFFHLSRKEYVSDLTWIVGEADAKWDWTRDEPPTPSQSGLAQ